MPPTSSKRNKRLLIADDHVVIAKGVKLLLSRQFQFETILECNDIYELIPTIKTYHITHLILDIAFPNESSIPHIDTLKIEFPELKIMLFTMHPKHLFINTLETYPDLLFCQKNANEEELIKTVKNLVDGDNIPFNRNTLDITQKQKIKLSKAEEQVLHLILDGKTTNEIAAILHLKSNTVSTYKRRIFDKTQTTNIMQLSKIYR